MGHLAGKDVYRKLGHKLDGLPTRVPWDETLHAILKELYTQEEADLAVRLPYGLANLDKIVRVTGYQPTVAQKLLDQLSEKGLVLDVRAGDRSQYMLSPLVIGIFEFTMMRTQGELKTKEWARLFHEYLGARDTFYRANCGNGQQVSSLRTIPHEGTIAADEYVEVLDYEKATAITESSDHFAIGICSCRHEKLHVGEKRCSVPLETCSTYGIAAETMIAHGFAQKATKQQMLDNISRSRELRLVLCADNVRKDISFICHCCSCCCNVLLGVSRFGYPNTVVSSAYIARIDRGACSQCGSCVAICPVSAITMADSEDASPREASSSAGGGISRSRAAMPIRERATTTGSAMHANPGFPVVNEELCLGCGVCALECATDSLKLVPRTQRVLLPEDTFERVILQALERGTLQNLLFDNPQSNTHGFMRAFVGGFLRLPAVKKAILSETLRSRFLTFMKQG
jgi:ferredoxin